MKKMLTKLGASSLAAMMAVGAPALSTVPVLAESPDDGITIGKTEGESGEQLATLLSDTPRAKTINVYFVTGCDPEAKQGGTFTFQDADGMKGAVSSDVVDMKYDASVKEGTSFEASVWCLSYEVGSDVIGRVPSLQVQSGEKFFGWFDETGHAVTKDTPLTDGAIYYAAFDSNCVKSNQDIVSNLVGSVSGETSDVPDVPSDEETAVTGVTFKLDVNKGEFTDLCNLVGDGIFSLTTGADDSQIYVEYVGNKPVVLPTVAPKDGFQFDGWQKADGTMVTSDTELSQDDVLTAVLSEKVKEEPVNVTFKLDTTKAAFRNLDKLTGEGISGITAGTDDSQIQVTYTTSSAVMLPKVGVKDGYKFAGWQLEDGTVLKAGDTVSDGAVVTAVLKEKSDTEIPDTDDQQKPDTETPDTDDQQKPDTETPDTDDQQKPDTETPDTDDQQKPDTETPDTDDQQKPDTETPDAEDGTYTVTGTDVNGQTLELVVEPETTLKELTEMLGYKDVSDWILSQEIGKLSFEDGTSVGDMTVAQMAERIAADGAITIEFLGADGTVIDTRVMSAGEYEDEFVLAPEKEEENPNTDTTPNQNDDSETPDTGDKNETNNGNTSGDKNDTTDKDSEKDDSIYSGEYKLYLTRVDSDSDTSQGATVKVKGNNTLSELADALGYKDITKFAMRQASGSSVDVNGNTKLGDIFQALADGEAQLLFYQGDTFYMSLILSPVPDEENAYYAVESKDEKADLRTMSEIKDDMAKGKGEGETTENTVSKEGKGDSVAPGVQTDDTNTVAVYGVAGGTIVMAAGLGVVIYRKKFMPV